MTVGATTILVTVTYNGAEVWDDFYASLMSQDDSGWRLIVVDNASSDSTRSKLRSVSDPRVDLVLNDQNVGVAAANNQGILRALESRAAQRIVLINNDTTFPADLLSELSKTLTLEQVDAVSPLIAFHDDPNTIWYGGGGWRRYFALRILHTNLGAPLSAVGDVPFVTSYAPTCCVMFDRSVFESIGVMDEQYFVYWDDADLMWRMKLRGLRLMIDPRVVLLHKVSTSTGGALSDFSIRFLYRNQMLFLRKFHRVGLTAYTILVLIATGLARVAARRERPRHFIKRIRAIYEGLTLRRYVGPVETRCG